MARKGLPSHNARNGQNGQGGKEQQPQASFSNGASPDASANGNGGGRWKRFRQTAAGLLGQVLDVVEEHGDTALDVAGRLQAGLENGHGVGKMVGDAVTDAKHSAVSQNMHAVHQQAAKALAPNPGAILQQETLGGMAQSALGQVARAIVYPKVQRVLTAAELAAHAHVDGNGEQITNALQAGQQRREDERRQAQTRRPDPQPSANYAPWTPGGHRSVNPHDADGQPWVGRQDPGSNPLPPVWPMNQREAARIDVKYGSAADPTTPMDPKNPPSLNGKGHAADSLDGLPVMPPVDFDTRNGF